MTDSALIELSVGELSSGNRAVFLSRLVLNLSLVGRSAYPEAGGAEGQALASLKGVSEAVLHVLGNQLLKEAGAGDGYPDAALIESLLWKADHYGIGSGVRWAIERSAGGVR